MQETQKTPVQTCRHHWIIQPANGPISPGICQNCGEGRDFKNHVELEGGWTGTNDRYAKNMGVEPSNPKNKRKRRGQEDEEEDDDE